jgi:hypothetical protein
LSPANASPGQGDVLAEVGQNDVADGSQACVEFGRDSGNQNVVLTSFTDPFGNTVSMLRVKLIYIENNNSWDGGGVVT